MHTHNVNPHLKTEKPVNFRLSLALELLALYREPVRNNRFKQVTRSLIHPLGSHTSRCCTTPTIWKPRSCQNRRSSWLCCVQGRWHWQAPEVRYDVLVVRRRYVSGALRALISYCEKLGKWCGADAVSVSIALEQFGSRAAR